MATPKSQISGASFLGIRWNGGERAPLLPHTPPPSRTRGMDASAVQTSRTGALLTSLEALHDLFEDLAAMLEVVEHVERGARGREEHDAARRRQPAGAVHRFLH